MALKAKVGRPCAGHALPLRPRVPSSPCPTTPPTTSNELPLADGLVRQDPAVHDGAQGRGALLGARQVEGVGAAGLPQGHQEHDGPHDSQGGWVGYGRRTRGGGELAASSLCALGGARCRHRWRERAPARARRAAHAALLPPHTLAPCRTSLRRACTAAPRSSSTTSTSCGTTV